MGSAVPVWRKVKNTGFNERRDREISDLIETLRFWIEITEWIKICSLYQIWWWQARSLQKVIKKTVWTGYKKICLRPGSWSRSASRTKMKVLVYYEVLVLVLNIWSWSWSRSWRKSLAVFQDFCCNSWRQWARHTMWHFVRDNKNSLSFGSHCLREPSAALHAHQPQLRGYLTMGAIC